MAWPSAVTAAADPFDSVTWLGRLQVVTERCGADPARLAAMGEEEFLALATERARAWGASRADRRIARNVLAVLDDPDAVGWSRRGLFRRVADELGDLQRARAQLRAVEADMAGVLADELGLSRLGDIPGLTLTGAAVILAEAGDPRRYETSSSLVKHAGLSPADNSSGAFEGQSHISRRGRPALRTAAWRAVLPLLLHNPVMAAKYQALVAAAEEAAQHPPRRARPGSAQAAQARRAVRSARAKARVACAASLLRWIYFMTVHDAGWDPVAASGGRWTPRGGRGRLTRGQTQRAGNRRPKDHPPRGRGGRARMIVGGITTPRPTLGSPPRSPVPPASPVERCRGRPRTAEPA